MVLLLDSRALRRDSDWDREGLEGVWISLDVGVESESDRGVDRMTCWNGSRGGIFDEDLTDVYRSSRLASGLADYLSSTDLCAEWFNPIDVV
jgi:hypothetical protein